MHNIGMKSDEKNEDAAAEYFSRAINGYCEELASNGFTEEEFVSCLIKVARKNTGLSYSSNSQKERKCTCSCVFKSLWLLLLCFLAFALLVAGFKPLSFLFHKWVHNKLHYVLRPLRILVATLLPYLAIVHLDFLHSDCLLPNPLMVGVDGCPCFYIKRPVEIVSNNSAIPSYLLNPGILDVHILRNYTLLDSNFSIDTLINFPVLHNGVKPLSCMEVPGPNTPLHFSYEFYNRRKIYNAFSSKQTWSLSWLECPQEENLFSLQEVIPPLNHLSVSTNSTFNVGTKWAAFASYEDFHPDATMIIIRVLVGHVRFVMEARKDACFEYCTKFKENPVLQPGDALVFNQRAWNFGATAWADVTFFASQVLA